MRIQRYDVLECIHVSKECAVYYVWDLVDFRICALKIIRNRDLQQIQEYEYIYEVMKNCGCTGVVPIYECFVEEHDVYVSMKFLYGKSLIRYIDERIVVSLTCVKAWMREILEHLYYLHHVAQPNITFVDIKPQNIVCTTHNKLYFIDCDSCIIHPHRRARSATRGYAPKEVLEFHQGNEASDIYSFGMCFYVMIHGHFPTCTQITHPFDSFLLHCLQEDVQKRYHTFKDVKKALSIW